MHCMSKRATWKRNISGRIIAKRPNVVLKGVYIDCLRADRKGNNPKTCCKAYGLKQTSDFHYTEYSHHQAAVLADYWINRTQYYYDKWKYRMAAPLHLQTKTTTLFSKTIVTKIPFKASLRSPRLRWRDICGQSVLPVPL